MKKRVSKALFSIIVIILSISLLFFLLRGPYLSNSIKRVILPVLEKALGKRIIIDSTAINLFPLYLQAKGVKVFDEDGNRLLWVTKARAYIEPSGLFFKEIRIRRLSIKEPNLTIEKQELQKTINHIKNYLHEKKEDITVTLSTVKIRDGQFTLSDTGTLIGGKELHSEITLKDIITARLLLKDAELKLPDRIDPDVPKIKGSLEGTIKTDGKRIELSGFKIYSPEFTVSTDGEIYPEKEGLKTKGLSDEVVWGRFTGKADINILAIKKIFNLKSERGGELSFDGSMDLISNPKSQIPNPKLKVSLNLRTKGEFYLETLMELLKVKDIAGFISLDGKIQGVYPEIFGEAKVTVKNAMLDALPLDDIKGTIKYKSRRFSLEDFTAHTYSGELIGKAELFIPHGDYSVTANVVGINSHEFFKFIKWQPPFPHGKIGGDFELNKIPLKDFNISATVCYTNTLEKGQELNERLKTIKARLNLKDRVLTINNSVLSTLQSDFFIKGDINLEKEKLNLSVELQSKDALDLTKPHYDGVRAPVRFTGKVNGSPNNPEISGNIDIEAGTINEVPFTLATAEVAYTIKSLSVESLKITDRQSIYEISGNIKFRNADKLFSFDSPYYDAVAVIKNGDAKALIEAVRAKIPITGSIDGKLSFKGDTKEFSGNGEVILKNSTAFGQIIDRAHIKTLLSPQKIDFSSVDIMRSQSRLRAKGSLYFDERFDAIILSDNIELKDVTSLTQNSSLLNARFGLNIKGSGTIKKPDIKFSLNILESRFKGVETGKGFINGELKDQSLSMKGEFLEGIITVHAKGIISKPFSWDMNVNLKKGEYRALLTGFLKDVPEDLSLSLEGDLALKRHGEKISMDSRLTFINLFLYGQDFRNKGDVVFKLADKDFVIKSFLLIGKDAEISAGGSVIVGQNYNISVKGALNLATFKAITKSIESVNGRGNFAISVSGPWKAPELRGGISIRDSNVILSGFPYKISSLNGDISLNKDKLVLDSLTADFALGKVAMSGIGYLKGFTIKRLSISSTLNGIKLRHLEGVNAVLDGKLFYDYSQKRQSLIGDIYVKKAKYEKRIEWKSWLLAIKEVKKADIKRPSLYKDIQLNVRIIGEDNIAIDNNIVRAPVKIDLTISGTPAQYGLIGKIKSKEGNIFFRGNEFEIIDVNIDFNEPQRIVPIFNIQAKTFTKGYHVRLALNGPADKFTLLLSSNPPLSDTDIFALLTAGQVSKDTKGFESGIGATEATALLTGRLQDVMEERLKYITGFERFEINPHTTQAGAVSPKVTVGKRLLGEKLFATYSTSIGTTEEHIIKLEYPLDKNTSLIGSSDERGSVGADIKFRFEFK